MYSTTETKWITLPTINVDSETGEIIETIDDKLMKKIDFYCETKHNKEKNTITRQWIKIYKVYGKQLKLF